MSDEDEHPPCDECGQPFTDDEWEDRHWPSLGETHAACCPECNP